MKKKKLKMFKTLGMLLSLSTLLALPAAVLAADIYPSKPVRLIIPFAPGGSNDIIGRLIAGELSKRLGKQVVVDNRGGGGGIIGSEAVAKADSDGYTLLIAAGFHTTLPALYKLPYDPIKSFTPVSMLGTGPYTLVVHPSVPANSVKELIALAKQKPGQLIFPTSGIGGTLHMGLELLKMMADIDFKIVHFKGGGPATIDLLGGHSHAYISPLITALPHIKSGKLRVLGTGGAKRTIFLPAVPTISEAGVPGYEVAGFYGIVGPAGMPAPIVDRLNKEFKAILASEDVKKRLLNEGAEVEYQGPSEFGAYIEKQIAKWADVVKKGNIKVEE